MSKANREKDRIARWSNLIETALAKLGANNPEELELIKAAASVAGMSPAAFILEMMKREKGEDESYDDAPARTRDRHERETVGDYVFVFSSFNICGLTNAEKVEAVRRFFKFGDRSLSEAKGRAISHALRMARNAAA